MKIKVKKAGMQQKTGKAYRAESKNRGQHGHSNPGFQQAI